MRTPPTRRPPSLFGTVAMLVGTLLLGGAGVTGALAATGYVDLPFFRRPVNRDGMVAVPSLPIGLPAYTRISREHLFDPATGKISYIWMAKDEVDPRMLLNLGDILGRVLSRDKTAAYAFTEADFLPKGTRPGVVAGIPPGKRSFVLDASKVRGVHALKQGDRFDLLATATIDIQKLASQGKASYLALRDGQVQLPKQSALNVLVHNGVVVQPVTGRSASSDPKKAKGPPIDEIILAIAPDELIPLTDALAQGAEIMCVARSGHPDDPGEASITPAHNPLENMRLLEEMRGFERTVRPIPAPSARPAEGTSKVTSQTPRP